MSTPPPTASTAARQKGKPKQLTAPEDLSSSSNVPNTGNAVVATRPKRTKTILGLPATPAFERYDPAPQSPGQASSPRDQRHLNRITKAQNSPLNLQALSLPQPKQESERILQNTNPASRGTSNPASSSDPIQAEAHSSTGPSASNTQDVQRPQDKGKANEQSAVEKLKPKDLKTKAAESKKQIERIIRAYNKDIIDYQKILPYREEDTPRRQKDLYQELRGSVHPARPWNRNQVANATRAFQTLEEAQAMAARVHRARSESFAENAGSPLDTDESEQDLSDGAAEDDVDLLPIPETDEAAENMELGDRGNDALRIVAGQALRERDRLDDTRPEEGGSAPTSDYGLDMDEYDAPDAGFDDSMDINEAPAEMETEANNPAETIEDEAYQGSGSPSAPDAVEDITMAEQDPLLDELPLNPGEAPNNGQIIRYSGNNYLVRYEGNPVPKWESGRTIGYQATHFYDNLPAERRIPLARGLERLDKSKMRADFDHILWVACRGRRIDNLDRKNPTKPMTAVAVKVKSSAEEFIFSRSKLQSFLGPEHIDRQINGWFARRGEENALDRPAPAFKSINPRLRDQLLASSGPTGPQQQDRVRTLKATAPVALAPEWSASPLPTPSVNPRRPAARPPTGQTSSDLILFMKTQQSQIQQMNEELVELRELIRRQSGGFH